MKKTLTKILLFFVLIIGLQVVAQKTTNVEALLELSDQFRAEWDIAHEKVLIYALKNNMEIWQETEDGRVIELVDVRNGEPIFFVTDNLGASKTTRVSELWVGGSTGLEYTGEGYFQLGEWDAGHVRKTHQEFMEGSNSRAYPQDGSYSTHYHATHVAGTMIAAGVVGDAKGALYGGNLKYWQWSADDSEMAAAAANGLEISNHSYGYSRGWRHDNGNWVWHGNVNVDPNEDYKFGFYDNAARAWDQIAWNAPNYLIVKSAGNDRGDGPSNGEHEIDGGDDGYDCIGTRGVAKNIMTVGAVREVLEYDGPNSVVMSGFSCWGPADDGRVKPDIVGKGVDVYSTMDGSNSSYSSMQGTSMSAPNVSGSLAMLQFHYQETHNDTPMLAATLKGLALHTTDEAGDFPGPDYMFGWGLMNSKRAAELISDDVGQNVIDELELTTGNVYTREVFVPAGMDFKVTICWTDVPGTPTSPQLNPSDAMLVNDLDLRIEDEANNDFYPWQLDRDNPSAAATNWTKNYVDNVEKIEIDNAEGGNYIIYVDYDGSLSNGSQAFSIIISGIEDYLVVPECSNGLESPVDGGTDAFLNQVVTWIPALFAGSYDVYFGTDGGGITTPTNVYNGENFINNSFSYFMNRNTTYYLQVIPKNNQGGASGCDEIWSFTSMEGISAYPYEQGIEDAAEPDLPEFWQSYDYSEQKWTSTNLISHTGNKAMACFYNGALEEFEYDNWFVSPPFVVADGNEYNATFFYKGLIPGHSESMKVYWGYSPNIEDLTNLILEDDVMTQADWAEGEALIIPNTDTLIFLGFHLISTNGYGAFLDDIKLEDWGTVGIENSPETSVPKIYSSAKNIIVSTDDNWKDAGIDIVSIVGRKIISVKHNSLSTINMNSHTPGVYLVRVYKDGESITKKVIIR